MSKYNIGNTVIPKTGKQKIYRINEVLVDHETDIPYYILIAIDGSEQRMCKENDLTLHPLFQDFVNLIYDK